MKLVKFLLAMLVASIFVMPALSMQDHGKCASSDANLACEACHRLMAIEKAGPCGPEMGPATDNAREQFCKLCWESKCQDKCKKDCCDKPMMDCHDKEKKDCCDKPMMDCHDKEKKDCCDKPMMDCQDKEKKDCCDKPMMDCQDKEKKDCCCDKPMIFDGQGQAEYQIIEIA